MTKKPRKKGGGGPPGADLTNPRSPRYGANLTGVAVRLPADRIELLRSIVETRNVRARRDGLSSRTKLSEIIRHVFELGLYELQLQEALLRLTRQARPFTVKEVADLVRLPEGLLRRELGARGVALPSPEPGEVPWPAPRRVEAVPVAETPSTEPAPDPIELVRQAIH